MQKYLLIFATLLAAVEVSASYSDADLERVAKSKKWLRLLHFKKSSFLRRSQSLLDGPGFFFAENGKYDPKAELVATLAALEKNTQKLGQLQQVPQCAFPERYRYLKQELKLKFADSACPKYEEFLRNHMGDSVSYVFSSAYSSNPASMFGHTFLKINSKKPDLLQSSMNYAAWVPEDANSLAFIVLGLTGGYKGHFSTKPYYAKVTEYVHGESRDLWEYKLNFNKEETRQLLAHLWELESNSWFDYFFFDENCSYHLLAVLEAVKLDWELAWTSLALIPGESVKRLTQTEGAVVDVKFRASLKKQMLQKYKSLSSEDKGKVKDLIDRDIEAKSVTNPLILETALSYLQFKKRRDSKKLDAKDKDLRKQILLHRSSLGKSTEELPKIIEDTRPDLGHDAYRIGIASGLRKAKTKADYQNFYDLTLKLAYHELLDKDLGFSPNSQINFPAIRMRYYADRKSFNIEELNFLRIVALNPWNFLAKPKSWNIALGYKAIADLDCETCRATYFTGGAGVSAYLIDRTLMWAALLNLNFEWSSSFAKSYRLGPELRSYFIAKLGQSYKAKLDAKILFDLNQKTRSDAVIEASFGHSYALARNWSLRNTFKYVLPTEKSFQNNTTQQGSLTIIHYYN